MSPSQVALCHIVWCHNSTTLQWNSMQNVTKSHFLWKYISPVLSYLGMIGLRWLWMSLYEWTHSSGQLISPKMKGKKWKSMYMYKLIGEVYFCGISDTVRVAIWRGQHRDFNKTLQNHNSLMDYSIFLKLLLIVFLNCFPFIQFTLIFRGTAPLSVNRTFCFSVRTSLQNMHGNVWGSFTVCNTHWILFETKFCIQS